MADKQLWDKIHAARADFADFVEGLSPEQLEVQSLCGEWRVRDVIGHMLATAHVTPFNFLPNLIANGFSFNRFADKKAKQHGTGTAADLAKKMRATTTMTKSPPGPTVTVLGEMIVHGEDVRRPLGIKATYPADDVIAVADLYKNSNLIIGSKKRIAGLTLRATDVGWSTGSGPEVVGPGASLLVAMTGRKVALEDLSGPGLEQFASRF